MKGHLLLVTEWILLQNRGKVLAKLVPGRPIGQLIARVIQPLSLFIVPDINLIGNY